MKIKSILLGISLAFSLFACAPKDADIQKNIALKLGDTPEIQVTVVDGVATITGLCKDETFKQETESIVKGVKGVKSVVNACELPPSNAEPVPATVIVNSDNDLHKSVYKVIKAYAGVNATVTGGVITLSGEIKREQLKPLMQSLQELKPKQVDNKLTIK